MPQTQDYIGGYQAGYADALHNSPDLYPVLPPPPPPPVPTRTLIPITADLTTVLNKLPASSLVQLVAGGAYVAPGVITLAPGVSVDMNNAVVAYGVQPGATSIFSVTNPNCEVFNLNMKPGPQNKVHVLFHVKADNFNAHDCVIGDGLAQVSIADVGGTHCTMQRITCGKTYSCTMFTNTDNTSWLSNLYAGSLNEVTLRSSPASATSQPHVLKIDSCTVYSGGANKGAIEFRQGQAITLSNSTLNDYVLFGEGTATAVGQNFTGTVTDNKFAVTPNVGNPQLLINAGCDVTVTDNTLYTTKAQVGITVNAFSKVTASQTTRVLSPAGTTGYRTNLIGTAMKAGTAGYPTVIESGSVVK